MSCPTHSGTGPVSLLSLRSSHVKFLRGSNLSGRFPVRLLNGRNKVFNLFHEQLDNREQLGNRLKNSAMGD